MIYTCELKKGKPTFQAHDGLRYAIEHLYGEVPKATQSIRDGSYRPLSASGKVIKKLKKDAEIIFKDIEVIEELGLHLHPDGLVDTQRYKGNLEQANYNRYKMSTSTPNLQYGSKTLTYTSTNSMKYSFGVEIETSGGQLPCAYALANKLNVNCERDGSIRGGEYVTGVLRGDSGFIQLNRLMQQLRNTCVIDKTCGIHVHIGGANFNKAFTVFSYLLGMRMEQEIFATLPPSRTDNEFCDSLLKLECASVETLIGILDKHGFKAGVDMCYDILYKGMSYGDAPDEDHNKLVRHKFGRYCGKYHDVHINRNFRYKWLNLIPANFNMKNASNLKQAKERTTIEFRNHSASLSYIKVRNWVLLCMSFVSFVENNKNDIINLNKKITISDILNSAMGRKKAGSLIKYFEGRKKSFSTKDAEKDEYKKKKERELRGLTEIVKI